MQNFSFEEEKRFREKWFYSLQMPYWQINIL